MCWNKPATFGRSEKPLEQEVLLHFEQIMGDGLRKLAISLVKVIAELDPEQIILELEDFVHDQKERREAVIALHGKQQSKRKQQ